MIIDTEHFSGKSFDRGGVAEIVAFVVVAEGDFVGEIPGGSVVADAGAFAVGFAAASVGADGATVAEHGEVRGKTEHGSAFGLGPGMAVVVGVSLPEVKIFAGVVIGFSREAAHHDDASRGYLRDVWFTESMGVFERALDIGQLGPWLSGIGCPLDVAMPAGVAIGGDEQRTILQGDASVHAIGAGSDQV